VFITAFFADILLTRRSNAHNGGPVLQVYHLERHRREKNRIEKIFSVIIGVTLANSETVLFSLLRRSG